MKAPRSACRRLKAGRRAVVTLLTLLCVPLLLTLLCAVAEVNHLWQARLQLENALEAASLAAIKEWGDLGGSAQQIPAAQHLGRAYSRANLVQGLPLDLDDRNLVPSAVWRFGTASPKGTGFDFTPCPDAQSQQALLLQATIRVPPLWKLSLGHWIGYSTITVQVAAYYDASSKPPRPRLIRLHRPCDDGGTMEGLQTVSRE